MKFEAYKIEDLFNVTSTKSIDAGKLMFVDDGVNFVGRTSVNNGIQGQIEDGFLEYEPNIGDTITVSQVGTMVAIYQDEPYYASQNIAKLSFKHGVMGKRLGLYFTSLINKLLTPFVGYNTPKLVDIKNFELLLPATPQGTPDFDSMENYIKEIEQKHIKKLESDLATRTEKLLTAIGREDLVGDPDGLAAVVDKGFDDSGVAYAEFRVGDLFDVQRGRRLKGADRESGDVVYCSATQSNNGVTDYIDNPLFIAENKVTVSTFLDVFYQEGEFTASDEITMLGADWLDRSSGLFIATAIKKSQHGYGYGHKAFSKEVSNFVINLPVTPTGQPDFDFMEQYIAHIELKYTHTLMQWIKAKELL